MANWFLTKLSNPITGRKKKSPTNDTGSTEFPHEKNEFIDYLKPHTKINSKWLKYCRIDKE